MRAKKKGAASASTHGNMVLAALSQQQITTRRV